MIKSCLGALAALAALVGAAAAAPVRTENVEAEIVSSRASVAPGERFTVGLRQDIREHWHTYWRNAGDSGIPTTIKWTLPAGFEAGDIQWPAPEAIKVESLTNYGYSGEVLFPIEMTAPTDAVGPVTLRALAEWLVCEEVCIPESAELELKISVGGKGADDPTWGPRLSNAKAALPQPADITSTITKSGNSWTLSAKGGTLGALLEAGAVRAPHFFPFAGDAIDHAAAQKPRVMKDAIVFDLAPQPTADLATKPLDGVITVEVNEGGRWEKRAFEVGKANFSTAASSASGAPAVGLLGALLFALLGGLILNVMPCVFPVLSMKALSLAKGGDEAEARAHGLLFLAGVLATFLALAGALIALQSAGQQIGWGFQLQEPLVVGALALLFFAIGLNLLGTYEIGGGVQNVGGGLAARGGNVGAFFTGALAVVAATPCTAPFMGAAMGFAATQPPLVSLAVFAALGLGFAAPFVLLSFAPAVRKLLPKPGAWMDVFKQFLAFPMFATTIWLVWVLTEQAGAGGLVAILTVFLAFAFVVWALRAFKKPVAKAAAVGLALLLVIGAGTFGVQTRATTPQGVAAASEQAGPLAYEAWSPEREAALRAEGKAVFVNFTAAWCVTCQVNEKVAIQTSSVAAAFGEKGVAYLKADWTARDSVIAQALKEHGRAGVPLYLYYPAGAPDGPAIVLPQILTPGIVLDAIGKTGAKGQ